MPHQLRDHREAPPVGPHERIPTTFHFPAVPALVESHHAWQGTDKKLKHTVQMLLAVAATGSSPTRTEAGVISVQCSVLESDRDWATTRDKATKNCSGQRTPASSNFGFTAGPSLQSRTEEAIHAAALWPAHKLPETESGGTVLLLLLLLCKPVASHVAADGSGTSRTSHRRIESAAPLHSRHFTFSHIQRSGRKHGSRKPGEQARESRHVTLHCMAAAFSSSSTLQVAYLSEVNRKSVLTPQGHH